MSYPKSLLPDAVAVEPAAETPAERQARRAAPAEASTKEDVEFAEMEAELDKTIEEMEELLAEIEEMEAGQRTRADAE